MPIEESARRMTALLNRAPRSRKTRAYLETFPRRGKIIVSPADYPVHQPEPIQFVPEPVQVRTTFIARSASGEKVATFVRKDRMRPRAKAKIVLGCRPTGRHRQFATGSEKLARTFEETMRQRFLLYVAQDGVCALCGQPMTGRPFQFSLDHVVPRSKGGADGFGNLVLCHGECNGRKTNDDPTGCEMIWLIAVNARLGTPPLPAGGGGR